MSKVRIESIQLKPKGLLNQVKNFYTRLGFLTTSEEGILTVKSTKTSRFVQVKPEIQIEVRDSHFNRKILSEIQNILTEQHDKLKQGSKLQNIDIDISHEACQSLCLDEDINSNFRRTSSSEILSANDYQNLKKTNSKYCLNESGLGIQEKNRDTWKSIDINSFQSQKRDQKTHVDMINKNDQSISPSNLNNTSRMGFSERFAQFESSKNSDDPILSILFDQEGIPRIKDPLNNTLSISFKSRKSHKIAVFTSGGDAPGMNTAIRAIVNILPNIQVFGVLNGYDGLINDSMIRLTPESVSYHSTLGGTFLRSARSNAFLTRDGRKKAVLNLVRRSIKGLIAIGGDGTMKGLSILHSEYKELIEELIIEGKLDGFNDEIHSVSTFSDSKSENLLVKSGPQVDNTNPNSKTNEQKTTTKRKTNLKNRKSLNPKKGSLLDTKNVTHENSVDISRKNFANYTNKGTKTINHVKSSIYDISFAAIPASIDNDISFCDQTIGANTCLHRIVDCIDSLASTMASHDRSFIIETMGRHCGWIALFSHFAVGAEYVFLPEIIHEDWEQELIDSILNAKNKGKKGCFIVLAEGASDKDKNKIQPEKIRSLIETKAHSECRVLKLGHIQRGGNPSAYDRILSTLLGIQAVEHVLKGSTQPVMATLFQNKYTTISLDDVIRANDEVECLQKARDFKGIMDKRGVLFRRVYLLSEQLRKATCDKNISTSKTYSSAFITDQSSENDTVKPYVESHSKEQKGECSRISESIKSKTTNLTDIIEGYITESSTESSSQINKKFIHLQHTDSRKKRIAIMQIGQRAGGINFALHVLVRYSSSFFDDVILIENGFEGLMTQNFICPHPYKFVNEVYTNVSLVTSSIVSYDPELILKKLIECEITSLVIIGDSHALKMVAKLQTHMKETNQFYTNIVLIPTCIENSLPNTDECLGTDSALNFITEGCDSLRNSSLIMPNTIFVAEISGCKTGYLTIFGGISSNAFEIFVPERKYTIKHLAETVSRIKKKFIAKQHISSEKEGKSFKFTKKEESAECLSQRHKRKKTEKTAFKSHRENTTEKDLSESHQNKKSIKTPSLFYKKSKSPFEKEADENQLVQRRKSILLIKDSNTFCSTNIDSFCKLLTTDSKIYSENKYGTKYCVFGDLVHGGKTSPLDRIFASVLAIKAVDVLVNFHRENKMDYIAGMLVKKGDTLKMIDCDKCYEDYIKLEKREIMPDWMKYSEICKKMESKNKKYK